VTNEEKDTTMSDPAAAAASPTSDEVQGPRPLEGLRVLDFTHAAAGPFATMWLADLGAEVVKIEKPGRGDGARYMGEPMSGPKDSDYFTAINTDKRSVLLNLHEPAAVEIARQLASHCDIVCENFRPQVMSRLGLGFEDLRDLREGLIYTSISAFGADGDWAARPANDIIMQGVSGIMSITGEPEGNPVRVGSPISDFSSGLFALTGTLAALHVRQHYPRGQHVRTTMFDSTVAMMANYLPSVLDLGKEIPRLGRGHPQIVPYQAFRCGDDKHLIIGAFTQGFWRRLCQAFEQPEWIDDPRFVDNAARVIHRDELVGRIEKLLDQDPRDHWISVLSEFDVPHSPVLSLREALHTEQAASGTFVEVHDEDGTRSAHTSANPARAPQWREREHTIAPKMGDGTQDVLTKLLGMDDIEIRRLADAGVIAVSE
jgi:crotonobetainyl-CoA:carnitine CoA-transferase CaiB-like acyl-CoA transferase